MQNRLPDKYKPVSPLIYLVMMLLRLNLPSFLARLNALRKTLVLRRLSGILCLSKYHVISCSYRMMLYKVCCTCEVMSSPHLIVPIPNEVGSSYSVVSDTICSIAIDFATISILLFSFLVLTVVHYLHFDDHVHAHILELV